MQALDQFSQLHALSQFPNPFKNLEENSTIKSVHRQYESTLALFERANALALKINDLREVESEFDRRQASFLGITASSVGSAFDLLKQSQELLGLAKPYPFLQGIGPSLLDYQHATAWINPTLNLGPKHELLSELQKFRALTEVADPLRLFREWTEQLHQPTPWGITRQVQDMLDALATLGQNMRSVGEDSSLEDEPVGEADLARVSGMMSTGVGDVSLAPDSIAELVRSLISAYEQSPSVRDKKIFSTYIYPFAVALVFAFLNPFGDFIVKQRLEAENATTEKAVKVAARESGVPRYVIDNFRFVGVKRLDVHKNGRMRSAVVGVLGFGQPVEVLKRDRDWTMVHYSDQDSDTIIQGWVLSRYLKRYR